MMGINYTYASNAHKLKVGERDFVHKLGFSSGKESLGHVSQLEPLVNKEDCKKACLQYVEHHPSTILSLAELLWISRHPVIKFKKNKIIQPLLKEALQ